MISLPSFYSDHALFQSSSLLTIKGKTDRRGDVCARIFSAQGILSEGVASPSRNGCFDVTLSTPPASFTPYCITVTCEADSVTFTDVLFGELWLACGQSNMELANDAHDDKEEMRRAVSERNIRFLHFDLPDGASDFPYSPVSAYESELSSHWASGNDELFYEVSAAATAFSLSLYDYLNEHADVPVGFADTCRGGTSIETWIPREELCDDETVKYFAAVDKTVTPTRWNDKGINNYQQPGAYYNLMMEALVGIKARGMLWYQGETNSEDEYKYRIYDKLMLALSRAYRDRYSICGDSFPVIAALIYPWTYGRSGECQIGYINDALVRLSGLLPNELYCVPTGDLPLVWDFSRCNHPIHPTHKYALGKRLAAVAKRNTYGQESDQPRPAVLRSARKENASLVLSFDNVGTGLYIDGKRLRGIYIRSKNGAYTPARAEILSPGELKVYHPYISEPTEVAYGISSAEPCVNLFAGDFPVCPFCTEFAHGDKEIFIQLKAFVDPFADSEWLCKEISDTRRIAFRYPIFHQEEGELCFDSDFSLSGRSLRIIGETGAPLSFSVKASPYHELELFRYSAIKACLLNTDGLTATLAVSSGDETITVIGKKGACRKGSWFEYDFSLDEITTPCEKMTFSFCFNGDGFAPCTVNVDEFTLVPKE